MQQLAVHWDSCVHRLATVILAAFSVLPAITREVIAQEVTVPLDRFEELYAAAHPQPEAEPAPPLPFAIDEAQLEIHAGTGSARIVQKLAITLFDDGWQTVPLATTGTFLAADLGTLEGRVSGSRTRALSVRGSGRHTLTLESLAPVREDEAATRPTWSLNVALPQAAVVRGVVLAGNGVDEVVLVSDGLPRGRHGDHGWLFAGKPGGTLRVNLLGTARTPKRSQLPLRFNATTATLTEVGRARTVLTAWIDIEVVQGGLDQLHVALPTGFDVVSVDGPPLAGWKVNGSALEVTPLASENRGLHLEIRCTGSPAATFASPALIPEGAMQLLAATAIASTGDALLEVAEAGSARLPEGSELARLPSDLLGEGRFALILADPTRPPQWAVTWPESSQALAAQVDRLVVDVLAGEAGHAAYQAWVVVRSSGAASLELVMPAGFELTAAARDGHHLIPGTTAGGLQLALVAGQEPQVLHLAGLIPLAVPADGTGSDTLQVPIPAVSAPASSVEARILLPAGRSYELQKRSQHGYWSGAPKIRRESEAASTGLAAWLGAGNAHGAGAANGSPYPRPGGFKQVNAAWSALSTAPASVTITVEHKRSGKEWF